MGTLIHNKGPVGLTIKHFTTSLINSVARGGKFAEVAASELEPLRAPLEDVIADLVQARQAAISVKAALATARDKATNVVSRVYDDTWNDIGRPARDAQFALIFPGGCVSYTEGDVHRLPVRMELLARLFEKKLHPKLSAAQHKAAAAKVRAVSVELDAALNAAKLPMANVELLEQTRTVMVRSAHAALTRFKRLLKNAGFTEVQIHEVIPHYEGPTQRSGAKTGTD